MDATTGSWLYGLANRVGKIGKKQKTHKLKKMTDLIPEGGYSPKSPRACTGMRAPIRRVSGARIYAIDEPNPRNVREVVGTLHSQNGNHVRPQPQNTRETALIQQSVISSNSAKAIRSVCIWDLNIHLVPEVWQLLKRACSNTIFKAIIQIRRVCQRDGLTRFEADIPNEFVQILFNQLRKVRFRFAWSVLVKRNLKAKRLQLAKKRLHRQSNAMSLLLCSYNINGFRDKREKLESYLEETKIDILGIQETRRKADHWRLHLRDYNCVEVPSTSGAGQRGIALAVRKGLNSFPVGARSPYFLFIRVFGTNVALPFIVGTVYLPHRHANTRNVPNQEVPHVQARLDLISEIAKLRVKYPSDLITLMGDFNKSQKEMGRLVRRLPGFQIHGMSGDPKSQVNSRGRAIDHFVSTDNPIGLLRDAHVDQSLDLSDHWPIRASLHYRIRTPSEDVYSTPRWKVPRRGEVSNADMNTLNSFAVLAEEDDDEGDDPLETMQQRISSTVTRFINECNRVGKALSWLSPRMLKTGNKQHPTSNKHQRACKARRGLYCEYRRLMKFGSPEEASLAFEAYKVFRKTSGRLSKVARRERWAKDSAKASSDLRKNPRELWRWLSNTVGWKRKNFSDCLQPVMDSNGLLQTEGGLIRAAWRKHYGNLTKDHTGHSQNPEYWVTKILDPAIPYPTLDTLNEDITEEEVEATLKKLKRNKAPGPDRIPIEFFQLFGGELLTRLTAMLQDLWVNSFVPDSLNVSCLVSVFKKGDPTDTNNYRGISLIDSLGKILITLLTTRLQQTLEDQNILIKGQSGFRSGEEAVAQALALYEIIKRRQNVSLDTFALFLDYEKAFDSVPHEGLFRKMDILGIRGRMLAFVRALYMNSQVMVKSNDGSTSTAFDLQKGVRQGCPMSPILFNIYINDMFEGSKGCKIPKNRPSQGATPRVSYLKDRVPGLLFADDAAILANSAKELGRIMRKVCVWSNRMDLTFGIAKCGLMCFTGRLPANNPDHIFSNKDKWSINGTSIPVVSHYTYLGLDFYPDLDMKKMIAPRLTKGRNVLRQFEPLLKCPSVDFRVKLTALRALVLSTMLYGAEIWGMKVSRADPQQALINRALRWILKHKGPKTLLSIGAMHQELGMVPIRAQIAKRRVRAYLKYPTLNTWVATLCKTPLRLQRKNWLTITEQWMNRHLKAKVGRSFSPENPPFGGNQQGAVKLTEDIITSSCMVQWTKSSPVQLPQYMSADYTPIHQASWVAGFGNGILLLMSARCGAYHLTKRLDDTRPVEKRYNRCPFCTVPVPEDIIHLFLHCTTWDNERNRFLQDAITSCERLLFDTLTRYTHPVGNRCVDRDTDVIRLLLGGSITGSRLPEWLGRSTEDPEVDRSGSMFVDNDPDEGPEPSPHWQSATCYQVAGYLCVVEARRMRLLAENYRRDGTGQNVLIDDRGPPGYDSP